MSAEEGALRPDHSNGEEGQDHGQHTIKPLLQETFPIPLYENKHTKKHNNIFFKKCIWLLCMYWFSLFNDLSSFMLY